jgi:hypothetical protein
MANTITASIYSYQANPDFTDGYGVQMGFPVDGIVIRDLPTPVVFQGVNCNSTIEVISDSDPFPVYFASETAATLIADANSGTTPSPDPTPISFPVTSTDAFGRLRVSEPFTLFDSSHRYADNNLWSTLTATGGAATFNSNQGLVDLTVTAASGSSVVRETNKVFSYQPGKSLLILSTFVMSDAKNGLTQSVGYFNDNNGFYVSLENSILYFVERSVVTGSIVNTKIAQSAWNVDKLNGAGPSGFTLDITKAQILWIDMEWLGVGSVRMGFVINGQFILCHIFNHANIIASTYITTASLPLRYVIGNSSPTTGSSTLKQICSTVISEGGYLLAGAQSAVGTPILTPRAFAVAGTYYPIAGLRLKVARLDAIVIVSALSLLGLGNGKNYSWRVVQSGSIVGGSWVSAAANSAVEYNLTGTSSTGGRVLASGYINSSNQGSPYLNILKEALFANQLERDGLTATPFEFFVEVAVESASGGEGVYASIDWEEISR